MASSNRPEREVVFVEGVRIPFQRSGTGYRDLTAYDLARMALKALLDRTELPAEQVDFVILGNVIQNVNNSNVARDAALAAGIPHSVPAYTVSLACISANKAITSAADLIATGQAEVAIAGGTESLTDIPIRFRKRFRQRLVESRKFRSWKDYWKLVRGLSWRDLLPEIPSISEFSTRRTMGEDCDRLAARIGVTRREQDEYALRSHQLAAKAIEEGLLDREVVPALVPPDFQPVERDNGPRPDSTLEKLQSLRPAFVKPHGTLTAGNSSFLTDGAAVTLLMSRQAAERLGYRPRAALRAYAYSAQDPFEELLLGPAYSIPRVLDRAGMTLNDIDVFELHEAFAAQVVANLKCLASRQFAQEKLGRSEPVGEIPLDKLNRWGGSLSIGHPFGATGARLVTTAVNRLTQEDGQFALVASCAAGAHGNAILLERLN
ncbi:MAG: acetyl-CoA C-acyltransferase [Calditrichaeota bacterium]|nr:MAG: acetyl-CoA C-acyltransferase [Calditrichota bacterium]